MRMRFLLCLLAGIFAFQLRAQTLPGKRALVCIEGSSSSSVRLVVYRYGTQFFIKTSFTAPMEMKRTSMDSFKGSDGEFQLLLRRIEGLTFSLSVSKNENGKSAFQALHLLSCIRIKK